MSDSETVEDVQYKVTKDFRKNVLKWVEIDDHIRILRAKVKEFNDEKKQYEDNIINYLNKVDEDAIAIKDGKLSKHVSKSKEPLKKENIHKSLIDLVGDSNKAMVMTEHIINNRKITEKIRLSRTKAKNTK